MKVKEMINSINIFNKKRPEKEMKRLPSVLWTILRAVLIIGISFIILYPIIVKFSASFMDVKDLFDKTVKWIPKRFTLENYRIAWEYMNYPRSFLNSFMLVTTVSILQLISCTMVGYSLGRFRVKGQGILFGLVIFTLIVPPQLILIPMYNNFRYFRLFGLIPGDGLNLLGSVWPFILMGITATGLRNG